MSHYLEESIGDPIFSLLVSLYYVTNSYDCYSTDNWKLKKGAAVPHKSISAYNIQFHLIDLEHITVQL